MACQRCQQVLEIPEGRFQTLIFGEVLESNLNRRNFFLSSAHSVPRRFCEAVIVSWSRQLAERIFPAKGRVAGWVEKRLTLVTNNWPD